MIFFYNTPLSILKFSFSYSSGGVSEYNPVEMDIVEAITYSEQVYWQQLWYFVIMVAQGEKLASVKRIMVREGSLDDIDVALIWHLGT